MKNYKKRSAGRLCVLLGAVLLTAAAVLMIGWQWRIRASEQQAAEYVRMLSSLVPEARSAVPEVRSDNTMPSLSLSGTNFVGILELPRYGSALPVCADWGETSRYPCRLEGSIYDGSLQIGATTQQGQYSFYREISVGDSLYFTDMTGNRYGYTVTDLRYEKHADQAALGRREADLTLFIKNVYAFEYLTVFCETQK